MSFTTFHPLVQKQILSKILAENPGLPCFCFGHSTGAAIILKVNETDDFSARLSIKLLLKTVVDSILH